jgi:hypothetical protein
VQPRLSRPKAMNEQLELLSVRENHVTEMEPFGPLPRL